MQTIRRIRDDYLHFVVFFRSCWWMSVQSLDCHAWIHVCNRYWQLWSSTFCKKLEQNDQRSHSIAQHTRNCGQALNRKQGDLWKYTTRFFFGGRKIRVSGWDPQLPPYQTGLSSLESPVASQPPSIFRARNLLENVTLLRWSANIWPKISQRSDWLRQSCRIIAPSP